MKIQKKRKKGKNATKNISRDMKNAKRVTKVLELSNEAASAVLAGRDALETRALYAEAQSPEVSGAESEQSKNGERRSDERSALRDDPELSRDGEGKLGNELVDEKVRRRNTDSREELVNAAMYLFWEKGYSETKMLDVYARSGVRSGSMYYFFKTKEELLLAVLDKLAEILYPALLAPIWEKESDPIERIFGLLGRYREAILASKFSYGCPVGRLATEIPAEMVEVHAKIAMNFEGWSSAVRKCLEAAGARLPKEMDLKMLSRFVLTVMEGGVMQSRSYRSIEPFDQAVAQLRDYFDRLEEQGEREAVQAGTSYWDLPKKRKRGKFPR